MTYHMKIIYISAQNHVKTSIYHWYIICYHLYIIFIINKLKLMLKHLHIIFISLIYHLYVYIYIIYVSQMHLYPIYIYIVCILHLYIICIACLNEIYDITFHIVRTQSWCVLIHYMCYLSEWDVYDLFVISSIWGGGAAPSPQPPSSFFKPSQAKPFLGPAPHAVSTTAGSYHWMLSRKPCQQQKKCKPNNKQSNKSEKLKHQWISRKNYKN